MKPPTNNYGRRGRKDKKETPPIFYLAFDNRPRMPETAYPQDFR